MANKQSMPNTLGQLNRSGVREVPLNSRHHLAFADVTEVWQEGAEVSRRLLEKRQKQAEESYVLEAEDMLDGYRQAMVQAETQDEINLISQTAERDLKNRFQKRLFGDTFWAHYGDKLLQAKKHDEAYIKVAKEAEFGKREIQNILAEAQNIVAGADGSKGEKVLAKGDELIRNSVFLSADEKNDYQQKFWQSGVLNLALNDSGAARKLTADYLGNNAEILAQINEVEKKRAEDEKLADSRRQDAKQLDEIAARQSLWQKYKNGHLSEAEYYVLSPREETKSYGDLTTVYQVLRTKHHGAENQARKIENADKILRTAYDKKELDLTDTVQLQKMLFDKDEMYGMIDKWTDEVCTNGYGDAFEREKAKVGLSLYNAYQNELNALNLKNKDTDNRAQAWADVQLKTAYKPSKETFADLRSELKKWYHGADEQAVWKTYFADSLTADDKLLHMRQAALKLQKAEMTYPRFYSFDEVKQADLHRGDKFYINGHLAVMKG